MRFQLEHRFPAPIVAVETAMVDPDFLQGLRLPDLAPPRVLHHEETGATVTVRVRYEYTGDLDSLARRIVRAGDAAWDHEVVLDRSSHQATFRMVPKVHAQRFSCGGTYDLREEAGTTVRIISGELVVGIPLLGKRAEQGVAPGMLRRMNLEADALTEWLARAGG